MNYPSAELIQLYLAPGIGERTILKILNWVHENRLELSDVLTLDDDELAGLFKLKSDSLAFLREQPLDQAGQIADRLYQERGQVITIHDRGYPPRLKEIDNPPPALFISGSIGDLSAPGIGFGGSRDVSEEGLAHTTHLAQEAVRQGYVIISGHARGVDTQAHLTALENDCPTILVIPEGILAFSLQSQLKEFQETGPENIIVVSEFSPASVWSVQNAMARNRTMIGLAEAFFIIEAGDSGGTLAAGKKALSLKRPLFVLDYPTPPAHAAGNKILLDGGARPIAIKDGQAVFPDLGEIDNDNTSGEATQLSFL